MKTTITVKHRTSPESEEMIFSFLRNHPQGTLATITPTGTLQSSVINIFALDDYRLAFMTKKETRKYKNLQHSPTVSFLTFDDFGRTEVEVQGIAQLVTGAKEMKEIMEVIKAEREKGRRHLSPYVTDEDEFVLFIIFPRALHMTVYWEQDAGSSVFHEAMEFDVTMTT